MKPSIFEAADWIEKSGTEEYKTECLEYWENEYGKEYVDKIKNELNRRAKNRKFIII